MNLDRIWVSIQEKIGLKLSPEEEIKHKEKLQLSKGKEIERENQKNKLLTALIHSDASVAEMEYILGITNTDPNPKHAIQYDPEFPPPNEKINPT